MQLTRRMRLPEAKAHVADKLGVEIADLNDPIVMRDVRLELGLGTITAEDPDAARHALAIEAKANIAALLDIPIRSVEDFGDRVGRPVGAR